MEGTLRIQLTGSLACLLAALCCLLVPQPSSGLKESQPTAFEAIAKYDGCVFNSTLSFLSRAHYPPSSVEELKRICKQQADGIRCTKDKTRGAPPLLRRGLMSYVGLRQKFHKKFCSQPDSEASRRLVRDYKCILEKRREAYVRIDSKFGFALTEIHRRNYNDSSIELKYMCCTFYQYKRDYAGSAGPECAESQATVEETIMSVIPSDLSLVCEEEEKMSKVCSSLEPLPAPSTTFRSKSGQSVVALGLYLFSTLGEPEV